MIIAVMVTAVIIGINCWRASSIIEVRLALARRLAPAQVNALNGLARAGKGH